MTAYGLIHAERVNIPVARACRVLGVSRSGYYQWLHRAPSTRSIDDAVLAAEVAEVFHEHRGRYGAPRVRRALRVRGTRPSRKRIARVMRALGLRGHTPRRYRKTTDSRHTKRIAPNLLERDFNVPAPNQVLAGDITYISTIDGWLYLAVLLDLYSRRVVAGLCRTTSTQSWLSVRCAWRRAREHLSPTGSIIQTAIAGTAATNISPHSSYLARGRA